MSKPRNIVILVADSLRYDSVHRTPNARLPYTTAHGTTFTQARSGGCWTLPATASLFTGLMPHEHGADAQSRDLLKGVTTLAERLQAQQYRTFQVTANVATTEVFGLDRGFDEIFRIWKMTPAHYQRIHKLVLLLGKPRLRRQLLTTDFVRGKLSEDVDASKVWLQSTVSEVFNQARFLLDEGKKKDEKTFLFLNLMETHFPYHPEDTFTLLHEDLMGQLKELSGLYHLANQTWMTTGKQPISPEVMEKLRERQWRAWERLAPTVDAFVEELHQKYDATVVFCSDHGDNFGDQGWAYRFSNVTEGGNRVPLFWLKAGQTESRQVHQPISAKDIYRGILQEVGDPEGHFHPAEEPEYSYPVMQSSWYNNQGQTLPRYKYNQICFLEANTRWLNRAGHWYAAPPATDANREAPFVRLSTSVNPLEEMEIPLERRTYLKKVFSDFEAFSNRIMENS
jgi:arylsulfatase A-like enzyme